MNRRHILTIFTGALLCHLLLVGSAAAFSFGFGTAEQGKSGLDFRSGYDVNTVATVSGRVASPPRTGEQNNLLVEVETGTGTVSAVLGPESFWEKKEIPLHVGDEVTVRGAKAQGKDGQTYLLAQKLTNRSTGKQVVLRDDKGAPVWSSRHGGMFNRPFGGMMRGGMMRGGGMMR